MHLYQKESKANNQPLKMILLSKHPNSSLMVSHLVTCRDVWAIQKVGEYTF